MTSTYLAGVALEMRWLLPLCQRLSNRPELLRALERETGLRRADPSDRSQLAHASFCDLIERLHAAGEPHICAWLALQFDASVGYGQVYFLRSSSQLREMLADLVTNQPLMLPFGYFGFFVNADSDSFEMRLQPYHAPTRLASRLLAEGALAWIKRILDLSLAERATPLSASSIAPPSPCREPLHALFGAPVQMGAPYSTLRYPAHLLDQTLPGGNPRIKHAMRAGFVALLRNSDAPIPLSLKLIGCFFSHTGQGAMGIESTALRLGLSGSALRRQLRVEGMRFSDIYNAHRRRLAFQLLVLEGAPVEAVVRSLGYASRFSLERAFATWFDTTPALARRDRLLLAAQAIAEDWSDPVALLRMLPSPSHSAMDEASLNALQQPAGPLVQAYLLGLANRAEYGGRLLDDARGLTTQLRPERFDQLIGGLHLQAGPGQPVAALAPLWRACSTALESLPGLDWFAALSADAQQRTRQDVAWYELGALLMHRMVGAPYGRLLREAQNWSRAQVLEQERKRFGLDRHTAGALLLSAWGLPRSAVHTQRAASQPVTAEAQRLAALYEPRRANSSPLCSRTKRL
ncbi:MAG: AraC family transcriptional regulator ligand-binding domain-containing protein [Acidovorax sp.]|uniref:AraC family transcriptional regulator ligand-binding domain-containing protein n=1 Tax=Acidovorax sp. TaxID=1872122 RepID=UPI0022C856E8|nr:AraC family transcriptional regulator ligand-binding domain-containing protein [Acidovorax sp.]MCZ8221268.1 AraC family transcriptional regulator ligand-binding domain-containing protein [Acidovorax sp.]